MADIPPIIAPVAPTLAPTIPASDPSAHAAPSSTPRPAETGGDSDADFKRDWETAITPPADRQTVPPVKEAQPDPNRQRGPDGKFVESAQPSPKPGNQPAKPVTATGPKELREELERTRAEAKANFEQRTALESKIKEYEARGKDTDALVARLDAREKEFATLQGELRAARQEVSPEFKQKYEEPFNRAATFAASTINGLTKADGTAASFDNDFVPLYRLPLNAAYAQAKEVFGDDVAPAVMQEVRHLKQLEYEKNLALEDEKKGWVEKQKQEEGRKVQERETWKSTFQKVDKDLRDSVEAYRDPVEDKEAAELRQKGYQIFDSEPKSAQQSMLKGAHVRHRVAAFAPNQLQISRLKAEVATLKQQLEASRPGQPNADGGRPGGSGGAPAEESWEDAARKYAST